ncbi:MAG: glycine cleavage system protein GcvH [Phycisphaera sp.]|nr:glycine cleavage system protein GcvH [Phycisphaera sp.]
MSAPSECRYLDSHEWHRPEGNVVTIGITRYAVDELTDVTYVELPSVGADVSAGESMGEIESVKATSDIYPGVSGKIIEINEALADNPGLLNDDPFGTGWLVKIEMSDASQLDKLMDADAYEKKYPSS